MQRVRFVLEEEQVDDILEIIAAQLSTNPTGLSSLGSLEFRDVCADVPFEERAELLLDLQRRAEAKLPERLCKIVAFQP